MASGAIDKLRSEIAELSRQQREVNERLNSLRGGRRGRGGFGRGGRGAGRGGRTRKAEDELEGPAPKRRLLSAVVKVNGDEAEKPAEDETKAADSQEQNVEGHQRGRRDTRSKAGFHGLDAKLEIAPRVVPPTDDPNLVKRNRRMFGALLGTLEKFKQEEKQLSNSEAIMRRSESLKRASERASQESEKLKIQEREHNTESRKRDLILRARLHIKAEEKQYELLLLQWTEHRKRLTGFLKTKAEPPIFFVPTKLTERDKKQLEENQKEFEEWKTKRKEELDEYLKELSEASMAKAEADVQRMEASRNKRKAQAEEGNQQNAQEAAEGDNDREEREEREEREDQEEGGRDERGQDDYNAVPDSIMEEDEEDNNRPLGETAEGPLYCVRTKVEF